MASSVETRKIIELLKHKHEAPEWAVFVELNVGTGGMGNRFIDFFAFNLYPSKRYLKVAYEIKVSRSDFAHELNQPKKRQAAEELADECYFATPAGMIKPDETPEGWGLIEMTSNGMRIKKRAMQRTVDQLPIQFVASLARRTTDAGPTLPLSHWLLAGKEVDIQMLQSMASDEVNKRVNEAVWSARKEERQKMETMYADDIKLRSIVRDRLGWDISNPVAFERWLDGRDTGLPYFTKMALEKIYHEIGKLLAVEKKKPNGIAAENGRLPLDMTERQ